MDTRLTRTCSELSPGTSYFFLMALVFIGLAIGGAIGMTLEGGAGLAAMLGGAVGLPLLVGYIDTRDGKLNDDECRELLDAAKTPAEKVVVRDLYCEKGCLMKSDALRIIEQVQQQQHADLRAQMECAG